MFECVECRRGIEHRAHGDDARDSYAGGSRTRPDTQAEIAAQRESGEREAVIWI